MIVIALDRKPNMKMRRKPRMLCVSMDGRTLWAARPNKDEIKAMPANSNELMELAMNSLYKDEHDECMQKLKEMGEKHEQVPEREGCGRDAADQSADGKETDVRDAADQCGADRE